MRYSRSFTNAFLHIKHHIFKCTVAAASYATFWDQAESAFRTMIKHFCFWYWSFLKHVITTNTTSGYSIISDTILWRNILKSHHCTNQNEAGHEKMCLMSYANNKGADQPAHPCSLISAFVDRCLDSIITRFYSRIFKTLANFSGYTGRFVSLAWSETTKDRFCRVVAQMILSRRVSRTSVECKRLNKHSSKCHNHKPQLNILRRVKMRHAPRVRHKAHSNSSIE